jgi:hypothetical protein
VAEVALTPRDALYDTLNLGERIGKLARANSLHVQDGKVVLAFDRKTEGEARADTELALRIELGDGWRERVVLT